MARVGKGQFIYGKIYEVSDTWMPARFYMTLHYTLNKILVEVGQVVGQSWSGLVNICQNMFLVINVQKDLC